MKQRMVIALMIFILSGCIPGFSSVTGSGDLVTEQRAVSGFTSIEIGSSIQATLEQGDSEGLLVEAEDNLIDKVETSVSGGKLTIHMKPNISFNSTQPVRVTVNFITLDALEVNSSARVTAGAINVGALDLRTDSSARLEIAELVADSLNAESVASSRVTLAGVVPSLELTADSSARFDAGDMQVETASVRATASSQVTLWVTEKLDVDVSSSAAVRYYGSPSVTPNVRSSGQLTSEGAK